PGDTPGIGTFHDFFFRWWGSEKKHLSHKKKSKRARKRKPKKGKNGEKAPVSKPGRVKRLVEWVIPRLDQKRELPSDRLFDFFQAEILTVSLNWDCLEMGKISMLPVTVRPSSPHPTSEANPLVSVTPKV
ncbi:hypothetical protein CAI16_20485, partial [Virgibacillus dokdonensis]